MTVWHKHEVITGPDQFQTRNKTRANGQIFIEAVLLVRVALGNEYNSFWKWFDAGPDLIWISLYLDLWSVWVFVYSQDSFRRLVEVWNLRTVVCSSSFSMFKLMFRINCYFFQCAATCAPMWEGDRTWMMAGEELKGGGCFVPPDVSISRQWSPPEHRHRLRGSMKTATLALSVMFLFWGLQFLLPKQKKLGPQHAGNNHSSIQIFTCT